MSGIAPVATGRRRRAADDVSRSGRAPLTPQMPGCDEQHVHTGPRRWDRRSAGAARIVAPPAVRPAQSIADHRYTTVIVREIPRPAVADVADATAW